LEKEAAQRKIAVPLHQAGLHCASMGCVVPDCFALFCNDSSVFCGVLCCAVMSVHCSVMCSMIV